MTEAYIYDAVRSPRGKGRSDGALHEITPIDLAAQVLAFWTKVILFMLFFIVIRFTLPRFRYDQLMWLGWKVLVPLALVNIVLTAVAIAASVVR